MKCKWLGLAVILFASATIAFASTAGKKSIVLTETVVVDGVALPPGEYTVEWSGAGPNVVVTFKRGNETFASVPAILELVKNPYDGAIKVRTKPSGTNVLVGLDWSKVSLVFAPEIAEGK